MFSVAVGRKGEPKIPVAIERIVRRQNLNFMHNRNQFCAEHFQFMRKLINCNIQALLDYAQQHLTYAQLVRTSLAVHVYSTVHRKHEMDFIYFKANVFI